MNFKQLAIENLAFQNSLQLIIWRKSINEKGALETYHHRCTQHAYQIMYSERLLLLASECAEHLGEMRSSSYLAQHAKEERGHEQWAKSDLEILDKQSPDSRSEVCSKFKSLIQRQFNLLKNNDLKGFLGYIIALEGFPGSVNYWESFSKESGIPLEAFKSAIYHARLDKHHSNELFGFVESEFKCYEDRLNIIESASKNISLISSCFLDFSIKNRRI